VSPLPVEEVQQAQANRNELDCGYGRPFSTRVTVVVRYPGSARASGQAQRSETSLHVQTACYLARLSVGRRDDGRQGAKRMIARLSEGDAGCWCYYRLGYIQQAADSQARAS
jgi:hypothetical protein